MSNKNINRINALNEMGIYFSGISMSLLINSILLALDLREQILLNFILGSVLFFISLGMLQIASRKKNDTQ